MKPFRTSITARMISLSVALALTGGGLAVLLTPESLALIPIVLLLAIGVAIIGMILGVNSQDGAVVVLSILLPLALLPYVMVLEYVGTKQPDYAWALVAAGLVPLALTLVAPITVRVQGAVKATAPLV